MLDPQLIRNDLAALAQTKDPKIARKIADKLNTFSTLTLSLK